MDSSQFVIVWICLFLFYLLDLNIDFFNTMNDFHPKKHNFEMQTLAAGLASFVMSSILWFIITFLKVVFSV